MSKSHQDDFSPDNVVHKYLKYKAAVFDPFQTQMIIDVLTEIGIVKIGKKLGSLLDVGCASGYATGLMAKYFQDVIGIDPCAIEIAKATEMKGEANVQFRVGIGEKMPVLDDSVDVIVCLLSAQCIDLDRFVEECRRVLKSGGVVIIYTNIPFMITSTDDDTLPPIRDEIRQMNEDSLKIAKKLSHPERHMLDRKETMYKAIKWPNKQNIEKYPVFEIDLAAFRNYRSVVPFYANLGTSTENPVVRMIESMKKVWLMEKVDEKNIKISVTFLADIIVLR